MQYYGDSGEWSTLKEFLTTTIEDVLKEDVTIEKFDQPGRLLVLFKIVSCPYCVEALKQWDRVEEHYKNRRDIHVAIIDCTRHRPVCHHFEVRRYPKILFIENDRNGNQQFDVFNEDRKSTNIIGYCERMLKNSKNSSL